MREPLTLAARSVGKTVILGDWYHYFEYVGVGSLQNLHKKGLVSGLDMVGNSRDIQELHFWENACAAL